MSHNNTYILVLGIVALCCVIVLAWYRQVAVQTTVVSNHNQTTVVATNNPTSSAMIEAQKHIVIDNESSSQNELESISAQSVSETERIADLPRSDQVIASQSEDRNIQWSMKLVNENVSEQELLQIAALGIAVIGGEWGIDEVTPIELQLLLDRVQAAGMRMVVNFSEDAAWGYQYGEADSDTQAPEFQTERVQPYIEAIKDHPALAGYDLVNEAGENLPNGDSIRITVEQMRQAADWIHSLDDTTPLVVRMHYWDEFDGDFGWGNPFAAGIADIVMLNLYSNYSNNGSTPAVPNMVVDQSEVLIEKVLAVDPTVRIWIALGAFAEAPYFITPHAAQLNADIAAARKIKAVENIGFFGWGPERYPQQGRGWYLPQDGPQLLEVIRTAIAE